MKYDGFWAKMLSASLIDPFIPSQAGVRTSCAPYDDNKLARSILILSGMTRINLYPRTAATRASPIPVLPLVGSTMVPLGLSFPCRSASLIMLRQIRSLTLPPGLKNSTFP